MFWTTISYAKAIHLAAIDLWLDPRGRREWAFVSHAHSDHIAQHHEVVVSAPTWRYLCQRRATPRAAQILPYREPRRIRDVEFTLYPAGHILGSAQALVTVEGQRLLYSGDFKLRYNHAAEQAEVPRAEVLIMETTFGHPKYVFPPSDEVIARMAAWCDARLAEGVTPVLLAYSLGKSQEVLAALGGRGYRFLLHPTIYDTTRIAEEFGVAFPSFERWTNGDGAGCVVIFPPHLRRWMTGRLPAFRTAVVTGWAFDPSARFRYGADAAFCLSDHADYADLLAYVERVGPRRIYTVHGYASAFANELRRRGHDATALDEDDQLALF